MMVTWPQITVYLWRFGYCRHLAIHMRGLRRAKAVA
jgi:hypothetical protein